MKYIYVLALLLTAACSLVVNDTPALRSAIETKYAATVAPDSVLPGVLRITLLTPPPVTIEPSLVPTTTPTPCRTIAGNINAAGRKLWHGETSPQWGQIRIDESKGERWFCDVASAEAAGWTRANP